MKIAFDHQIFTLQSYGGISRYFVRLAEQLIALGHDADIVAPVHRNRYLKELPSHRVHGIEVARFPPKTGRLLLLANSKLSELKIGALHADLIHETYYSPRCVSASVKGRLVTVYDMIHEKFPSHFPPSDSTTKNKIMAISRADHVLCISHSTKKDLCELTDIPEEKVTVVHLGYERLPQAIQARPLHAPAHAARPFLLYVGSRGGYKNFARMLTAVSALPRLKNTFDIVAFGGGPFNASELALICKLGFRPESVRQISGDDSALGALYSNAHAFVYPSVYEGFGLPPLEAMAHGCPVVASNSSSMPEVIGKAGEYFDPFDVEAHSCAIEKVAFDEQRRADLIELGRQRLLHFSWERCAVETRDAYRKVLEAKELN